MNFLSWKRGPRNKTKNTIENASHANPNMSIARDALGCVHALLNGKIPGLRSYIGNQFRRKGNGFIHNVFICV
jgi:hypothetical protein